MKKLLSLGLLGFLFCFSSQVFAQDYSGHYRLISDTNIDGNYTAQHTGEVTLRNVGRGEFSGSMNDRTLDISIHRSGGKTVFSSLDEGGGYVSCGTGIVVSGVFTGLFWDMNGTRGEFKMTKR